MIFDNIDKKRVTKEKFIAVVEIPQGCKNKYEVDKETGLLRLDRILFTSTHYPHNYGFIPLTYAEDGDNLDVLILCSEAIAPLTLVDCKPLGVVRMIDSGVNDEKIIAVCNSDPIYSHYETMEELPLHIFEEIKHFFKVYKVLEGKETNVLDIAGKEVAEAIIEKDILAYQKKMKKSK